MASFPFEPAFLGAGRRDFYALTPTEQEAVNRLVEALCRDPFIDNVSKYVLTCEPPELWLFERDGWSILYRIWTTL